MSLWIRLCNHTHIHTYIHTYILFTFTFTYKRWCVHCNAHMHQPHGARIWCRIPDSRISGSTTPKRVFARCGGCW